MLFTNDGKTFLMGTHSAKRHKMTQRETFSILLPKRGREKRVVCVCVYVKNKETIAKDCPEYTKVTEMIKGNDINIVHIRWDFLLARMKYFQINNERRTIFNVCQLKI